MENKLGILKEDYLADIVATYANPLEDTTAKEKVAFVTKKMSDL